MGPAQVGDVRQQLIEAHQRCSEQQATIVQLHAQLLSSHQHRQVCCPTPTCLLGCNDPNVSRHHGWMHTCKICCVCHSTCSNVQTTACWSSGQSEFGNSSTSIQLDCSKLHVPWLSLPNLAIPFQCIPVFIMCAVHAARATCKLV